MEAQPRRGLFEHSMMLSLWAGTPDFKAFPRWALAYNP